jgi:outer membrane protein assembly factor BamB
MDNRFSVVGANLYQGYWPGDPFSLTWAKLARYDYKTGYKEDLFTKETIPGYRFGISPPVGYINNLNDTLLIGVTSYQNYTTYHCVFQVYCFNLRTRTMEWENDQFVNDLDNSDNIPILIDNDKVIIQTTSKISCLNVNTGQLIWQQSNLAISLNMTIPLYNNGKVFCLTDDGKLYCFNAETGSIIWSNTSTIFQPIEKTNFIYYNGKIYFNSFDTYDMVLNCVSAETGEVIWRDPGIHGTMRGYLLLDENLGFLYGYFNGFVYSIDLNQTPKP